MVVFNAVHKDVAQGLLLQRWVVPSQAPPMRFGNSHVRREVTLRQNRQPTAAPPIPRPLDTSTRGPCGAVLEGRSLSSKYAATPGAATPIPMEMSATKTFWVTVSTSLWGQCPLQDSRSDFPDIPLCAK
jgi:hypothetical protein